MPRLSGSAAAQSRSTGWPLLAEAVAASASRRALIASSMLVGGVVPASTASMKAEKLQAVGVGVALQEEVEVRLLGVGHRRVGQADRGGADVLGEQGAVAARGLQALVIAGGAVAVVDDRGHRAGGGLEGDDGGVEVAGGLDVLVEVLAHGVDLDDVAQEEAGHVEVVDRHVAEDAARDLDVLHRRGGGVAADDGQLLQGADAAVGHGRVDRGEGGVEAAVEAEHDGGRHGIELGAGGLDVLHVQGDRLLAQDRLAGLGGREEVGDVQGGGRADDDGVDVRVGEDLLGLLARAGPVETGEVLGGRAHGVADEGELGLRVGGDGLGVDVADAAGADDGDSEHRCSSGCSRGCGRGAGGTGRGRGARRLPRPAPAHGLGMMTSRTRASRSASAWRKPRSVLTVAPKASNSTGVMPSGS